MSRSRRVSNPFPGLRPFETDEYLLFFGREGQSDALVERLERARFLAVVGTSGSGKSSLVRAGLLPALRGGMMSGVGAGWRVAIMRPGHDPVGNLAQALAGEGVLAGEPGLERAEAEAVIEATLRRGSLGLVEAVRAARLAAREKLLVVVDQFEELFRFRAARAVAQGTDDDASAFVKLLLEAARQREVPVYVVLTMRSDFLGDSAQFQGLPEAINDGQYLIPRMTRDERRFAIVGPARVARGKMTEPLVNRLLNDVGDNPDQLPILQHALMRTWDYWLRHRGDSEPVGLEHYEAVGTISNALSLHADEAYNELPDERSRRVAELLFKALTERGADNREIRRPTRLGEVCQIAGASAEEVAAVVDVFRREGRSFLMPPAGVALTPETVIDISHESLIRNWGRLHDWVRDEGEAARIYRRLAEAAAARRAGEGGLLDDVTLGWVNRWRERYEPNRAWGVRYHPGYDEAMAYLEESRAAQAARVAAEGERERRELEQARAYAEQQRRAARRLRWLLASTALMLLLAVATAGFAVAAQRRAVAAQHRAETEQQRASAAQRVAEQSRLELDAALKETTAAKGDAEKARDEAKSQAEIARREKAKAEAEERRADEEADRARGQAAAALEARRQALAAKAEAERRASALAANGLFRDATILAERGEFDEAVKMYNAAVTGLQESGVKDTEGVADTHVQIGETHFAAMYDSDLRSSQNSDRVLRAVESYDRALKRYEEAGLEGKAADTMLSVGATLLKIANNVSVGRPVSRASAELAALDPRDESASGPDAEVFFEEGDDPKVRLKNQALERYKRAFLLYRKANNRDGMMLAAYRIGNFYLRDELPAWQDKTPTLDIALCDASLQEYIPNRRKALCYFKELERLSLAGRKSDAGILRLLVWVGALHYELGERDAAESYLARARQAYLSAYPDESETWRDVSEAQHWAEAAGIAESASLLDAAHLFYDRALEIHKRRNDYSGMAHVLFKTGDLIRKHGVDRVGANSTLLALEQFRAAVNAYKEGTKAGASGPFDPLEFMAIGAFAEENYEEGLALDAYNIALARGAQLTQALAWSGIASVQAQSDPEAARQSYMRAFALYSKLREEESKSSDARDEESLKELERIGAAVLSLDREIKAKALARNQAAGADALCPFPVIAYAQPTATDGDTVTFSVYAVHPDPSKLTYEWAFSSPAAKVVESIDKPYPTVRVSTAGVGKADLTVTVVVKGGAGGCPQAARATTRVEARPQIPRG